MDLNTALCQQASFLLDAPILLPCFGFLAGRLGKTGFQKRMLFGLALVGFWIVAGGLYFDLLSLRFLIGEIGAGNHFMWNSGIELLGLKTFVVLPAASYLSFWSFHNLAAMAMLLFVYPFVLWLGWRASSRLKLLGSNPAFYNCWNQNVICQFELENGGHWFATFGKHSKHFPIYGVSYDNLMLWDSLNNTGYGLTDDVLPKLFFQWRDGFFRIDFKGEVSIFEKSRKPTGKTSLAVSLEFRTVPLEKNRFFLKRALPFSSRFVPGAVFQNQILAAGDSRGFLQINNKKQEVIQKSLCGHLENGASSFINSWAWNIVYKYLGVLHATSDETRFYYNWKLHPLRPHCFGDNVVNFIKRKINKEVLVVSRASAQDISHQHPTVLSACAKDAKELFSIPCAMDSFEFTRSFIEIKDNEDHLWHGILEDFKHPDIIE